MKDIVKRFKPLVVFSGTVASGLLSCFPVLSLAIFVTRVWWYLGAPAYLACWHLKRKYAGRSFWARVGGITPQFIGASGGFWPLSLPRMSRDSRYLAYKVFKT